jgi:hypothetical protein
MYDTDFRIRLSPLLLHSAALELTAIIDGLTCM